jgi:hypothetical protein
VIATKNDRVPKSIELLQIFRGTKPAQRKALPVECIVVFPGSAQAHNHRFARAIAKIAYCQAVARWGVKGFR